MSESRKLSYALIVSASIHFLVLMAASGSPGGAAGGRFCLPGPLYVEFINLGSREVYAAQAEEEITCPIPITPSDVEFDPATVPEISPFWPSVPEPAPPAPPPAPPPQPSPPLKPITPQASPEGATGTGENQPPNLSLGRKPGLGQGPGRAREDLGQGDGQGEGGLGLGILSPDSAASDTELPELEPEPSSLGGSAASRHGQRRPKPATAANAPETLPPRCASCPAPPYPAQALERELEGEVLLKVQVLPNGRVGDIFVEKSSGYPLLDEAALAGVKTWTFYPALLSGNPVAAIIEKSVRFQLSP